MTQCDTISYDIINKDLRIRGYDSMGLIIQLLHRISFFFFSLNFISLHPFLSKYFVDSLRRPRIICSQRTSSAFSSNPPSSISIFSSYIQCRELCHNVRSQRRVKHIEGNTLRKIQVCQGVLFLFSHFVSILSFDAFDF